MFRLGNSDWKSMLIQSINRPHRTGAADNLSMLFIKLNTISIYLNVDLFYAIANLCTMLTYKAQIIVKSDKTEIRRLSDIMMCNQK